MSLFSKPQYTSYIPLLFTHLLCEMTTPLHKIKDFFTTRSVEAYLVGGYVRDSLLGHSSSDVDVTLRENSTDLARELAHALGGVSFLLTEAHQVSRVVVNRDDGNRWYIDLSRLRGSIAEDLGRRDFTVDAMAIPLQDWNSPGWQERIIDPFGGRSDLDAQLIRAVKPAIFKEDPLRLIRGVRLAASLCFSIEKSTADLITQNAPLISAVAPERVRDEFLAILSLDRAKDHLETLDRLGLLCHLIPELEITRGVEQPRLHYWDVFGHSIQAVAAAERVTGGPEYAHSPSSLPWPDGMAGYWAEDVSDGHNRRTLLKLAALLHDVAKPQTKTVDSSGRTRFLGHHTIGASIARTLLHRLRLSARGVRMVCGMVEHHLRPTQMSQGAELPTPRAVYRYFRDLGEVAIDTLYLSLADHLAAKGPLLNMEEWDRHVKIITRILEVGTRQQNPETTPRLITGHDLISEFGLVPGPQIGTLLEEIWEAQISGQVDTKTSALAWVRDRLAVKQL